MTRYDAAIAEEKPEALEAARFSLEQVCTFYLNPGAPFRVTISDRDRKSLIASAQRNSTNDIDREAVDRAYVVAMHVLLLHYQSIMGAEDRSSDEDSEFFLNL